MKASTPLRDALGPFDLMTKEEMAETLELIEIASQMNSGHRETLEACRDSGPLWDGDVPSKAHRTDLVRWGAVAKVAVKGEQGFNACTYRGWALAKVSEALSPSRVRIA